MSRTKRVSAGLLDALLPAAMMLAACQGANAQVHSDEPSGASESAQTKIARALSAAPIAIAKAATVVEKDGHGNTIVLRKGTNEFTCMAGDPKGIGQPAMCMDRASMQWASDFAQRKPKPTNTVPGITYMLAGATQRSDSDPWDQTSPPIKIGPHWMIMWAGNPYAHVHVMGKP